MILSRRVLFTLPVSIIHNTSTQNIPETRTNIRLIPINIHQNVQTNKQVVTDVNLEETTSSSEKLVTISDINDVKFFNHCAKLFELYHDDYTSFNEYKKDQYKKYKLSLLEAYDNSCNMIESEDLKDFIREQGQTFSMENVCNIHECV